MEKEILMNQQENDKVEVMLQMIKVEYDAMREEINSTHSHIFTTMEISSATITALLAFLPNLQVNSFMFHFFLIVVILWICASSALIILSESQRMKRAGNYICILEEKVKNLCACEHESRGEGEKSWRLTQEKIEKWLKMSPSRISLLEPLCFERWIRELEAVNSPLGRANFLLIFRFALIYGGSFCTIFVLFLSHEVDICKKCKLEYFLYHFIDCNCNWTVSSFLYLHDNNSRK